MDRIRSLDALRGLAALQVAVSHALLFSGLQFSTSWTRFTPVRLFLDARPAVIFFFVLSGFVLTIARERESLGYFSFATRRVCRIYLPFAASIVIASILCLAIQPEPIPGSPPTTWDWVDYSLRTIARHFLMTGLRNDAQLNGVMWSLVHEMRLSLVIPSLILWLAARPLPAFTLLTFTSILAMYMLIIRGEELGFYFAQSVANSVLMSFYYIFPFAVGVLAAQNRYELVRACSKHKALALGLFVAGAFLIQRRLFGIYSDFAVSVMGGALIILTIASPLMKRWLESTPALWLGRVSYSLYLCHLLVYLSFVNLLQGLLPLVAIMVTALGAALVASDLMHRWIELPAIRLGRRL